MGCIMQLSKANELMDSLKSKYVFYAPKLFKGSGCFSDTDIIRYDEVNCLDEIVFDQKSDYSFKEVLLPISQTLFYFTEAQVSIPEIARKKPVLFLRSCDIHALKRLDAIYLENKHEDFYYKRLRKDLKIVLIGCPHAFDNCFCVDMGTNKTEDYDAYIKVYDNQVYIDSDCELLEGEEKSHQDVEYVSVTNTHIHIPENLTSAVKFSKMWDEYNTRCIACGRCNFACPTCTCFTMQDIFYKENENVGERRRVWASCQVDGFDAIAGGITFRKKKGEKMRYKVMHKVHDFKEKFGYHMCVGCGRCDDICPEYISFANCINKLEDAMKEVSEHE